jgi:hypothetical protein
VSLAERERSKGLGVRLSIRETDEETDTDEIAGGAHDTYLGCCVPVVSFYLHSCAQAALYALILRMHGAGLTKEADCALCLPGKYQTGVGLMAEANCTWCVAGKYQSGSGVSAAFWLTFWPKTQASDIDENRYIRGDVWLSNISIGH